MDHASKIGKVLENALQMQGEVSGARNVPGEVKALVFQAVARLTSAQSKMVSHEKKVRVLTCGRSFERGCPAD